MKNRTELRKRYLRDDLQIRVGGIAANLARVHSFSDHPRHSDIVENLLAESKFFIEWTAPDTEGPLQHALVELQLQLARWQYRWSDIWTDLKQRTNVAQDAQIWSQRLLEMSDLLDSEEDIRSEYDFSGGVRGKNHQAFRDGYTTTIYHADDTTIVEEFKPEEDMVRLEPDVLEFFSDSESVNNALRGLIASLSRQTKTPEDIE